MTHVLPRPDATPASLTLLYHPIRSDMEAVEEILRETMTSDHADVDEMVRHGYQLGGKRLRPALLLLAACGDSSGTQAEPTVSQQVTTTTSGGTVGET